MEPFACLYMEKGEPFAPGARILLEREETVFGRPSHDAVPDVALLNAFVSRRHLMIRQEHGQPVIVDLGSKHGTELEGRVLQPHVSYPLHEMDVISLAKGMVVMRFSHHFSDQTLELEPRIVMGQKPKEPPSLRVDQEKRVCFVNGEAVYMSEKEWRLFLMLYEKANILVTIEDIKRAVWPERTPDPLGVPDVGNEELSSLVYRVRKKLQHSHFNIQTIRGGGFIFETDEVSY